MMTYQRMIHPSSAAQLTPPAAPTIPLLPEQKIGALRVSVTCLIEMASRLPYLSALDRATLEHAKHVLDISKV